MSSSIIEAKFQQLDRTIKLLNKPSQQHPKVASSDQLRQLVYSQRVKYGVPKVNSSSLNLHKPSQPSASLRISNQDESQQPSTFRVKRPPAPRPDSSSRRRQGRPPTAGNNAKRLSKWIDPKQQRAEQILEDTWNEIEAATAHCGGSAKRPGSVFEVHESFKSRLLGERDEDDTCGVQGVTRPELSPMPIKVDLPGSTKAGDLPSESALAVPKPKSARQRGQVRCHSADAQAQSSRLVRNWFAPSEAGKRSRNAREDDHSDKQSPERRQERALTPSPASNLSKPESSAFTGDTTPSTGPFESHDPLQGVSIDDPSFYYLELRLEHPESLSAWRFHAVFTDLSVPSRPFVVLDELCVDTGNCLLFRAPKQGNNYVATTMTRLFDPIQFFRHVSKPRDLYGHCISILVTSTSPVNRVVIDTTAHFTHEPTTASPPQLETFDHLQLYPERFQQKSCLIRPHSHQQRSSSSRQGSADRKQTRTRSRHAATTKQRQLQAQPNVLSLETLTLQDEGECSPWEAGGDAFGHNASLAQLELIVSASKSSSITNPHVVALDSPARSSSTSVSGSPSPNRRRSIQYKSRQSGVGATSPSQRSPTIETKQQELLQMRSAMLRKLQQEKHELALSR